MNGLIVFSSFVLGIGIVLLIIGYDKSTINEGMNFSSVTKTTMQVIGIIFTLIGSLAFIFFVHRQCMHEHKKKYKDDTIKAI
uniref:Group-specific protein n=1 Tax=Strongyloides papillosus TaxID=174720 RepID=A0A0N5BCK7_STREA